MEKGGGIWLTAHVFILKQQIFKEIYLMKRPLAYITAARYKVTAITLDDIMALNPHKEIESHCRED
jgi:hypothetical protein